MKKVSAKRVFAIIGIVLGFVTAFVGGVIGVMAAMGKFKTPVVFPNELVFLNNDFIVVEEIPFDTQTDWEIQFQDNETKPTIHTLNLQGINQKTKHQINKKNCYIWFYQNVGANLITLCDEDGKPLLKDANNRYLVSCNEPVCYMINDIADDAETDGKVMLMARSENNKVQANVPLTFWIDRSIENVVVDSDLSEPISPEKKDVQTIKTGVDVSFDFKYKVTTPLSLSPIVGNLNAEKKDIELYYVATGFSTDYIKVTKESVLTSPLNTILTYDEENDVFKFKATVAGEYVFKIGAFATYQDKIDYESSILGLTIPDPNYHRTNNMQLTTLTVVVNPTYVNEIGLLSSNVILDLYSENHYITLDGLSGIAGAKDNNLELYMNKGQGLAGVADYSRFDEVTMNAFENGFNEMWVNQTPTFVLENTDVKWEYNGLLGDFEYESIVSLSEQYQIISYLYFKDDVNRENKYYCSNGVAVFDNNNTPTKASDDTIKMLKAGSYLNFYYKNADGKYTIANNQDFDFEANLVENSAGRTKSWQIITKSLPDLNKGELEIGILVVNNRGEFYINKFFRSIPVSVNELALSYEVKHSSADMKIAFADNDKIIPDALNPDYFVNNVIGSYNALVFVTKETANYIVKTIPAIKFKIGEDVYVLVGENINNQFINKVELSDAVKSDNKYCELRLLQLHNEFKQTEFDIINNALQDIEEQDVKEFIIQDDKQLRTDVFTIQAKYILNPELLTFEYNGQTIALNENISVYENTQGHQIIITSSENKLMIDKIVEFYKINETFFNVNRNNIDFTVTIEEGKIIITFDARNHLSDPNTVITLSFDGAGTYFNLPGLLVKNGSPDNIVLNFTYEGQEQTISMQLAKDAKTIKISETIKIVVGFDENGYTYQVMYNNATIKEGLNIFNDLASCEDCGNEEVCKALGFQGDKHKGQILPVNYEAFDKAILNTDQDGKLVKDQLIKKSGETVVAVSIGETVNYFKVEVDASKFELSTSDNQSMFDVLVTTINQTFPLNNLKENIEGKEENIFNFTYNKTTPVELSISNLVFVDNVKCISYGDGTLTVSGNVIDGWELKKDETTILNIKDEGSGWQITKNEQYVSLTISFDVNTINGSKNVIFNFVSTLAIDLNEIWNENREFYAGTQVLLYSNSTADVPVIKPADKIFTFKIKEVLSGDVSQVNGNSYLVPEKLIGKDIELQILLNETVIRTITGFKVKANVIASIAKSNLESETDYDLSELLDLQQYKNVIFGSSMTNLYYIKQFYTKDGKETNVETEDGYYKYLRNQTLLETLANKATLTIESEGINPVLSWNQANLNLSISEMSELKVKKTRTITLLYNHQNVAISTSSVVDSFEISIINKHDKDLVVDSDITSLKCLKEYELNYLATLNGFSLIDINADGLSFDVDIDSKTFKLKTPLADDLSDVELTLLFKHSNGQELTLKLSLKLIPYIPDVRNDKITAFSGEDFDLLNGIYNADTEKDKDDNLRSDYIVNDKNIKSLKVVRVEDENGKDITNEIIEGNFVTNGYVKDEQNPNCYVKLKEINEDEINVRVIYTIIYNLNNDPYYSYSVYLTIRNRQQIDIFYPEDDLRLPASSFKFFSEYEKDAMDLGGSNNSTDGIYTLQSSESKIIHYEPIMINTDRIQVIDFKNDQVKKLSRAVVENRNIDANEQIEKYSTNLNINLIAYQNVPGMADYVKNINTSYDTNKISLPFASQGLFGYIIFKLETQSGNYKYYVVYIFSAGDSERFAIENNLNVVAYKNAYIKDYTNKNVATFNIKESDTYSSMLLELSNKTLYTNDKGEDITFLGLFGKKFDKTTSLYLYDATYTGETDARTPYDMGTWQRKNVSNEKLTIDNKFNIITLGLLCSNGIEMYVYGTITIFIQPEHVIEFDNNQNLENISFDLPNGYFKANIKAEAEEISCPFSGDWTATIVSFDNSEYVLNDKYYSEELGLLKLKERVGKDTEIVVEYENDIGTIVYVEYTYKATEIPNHKAITVGEFIKEFKPNADDEYNSYKKYYSLNQNEYKEYVYNGNTWDADKIELFVENHYFNNLIFLKEDGKNSDIFFGSYEGAYLIDVLDSENGLIEQIGSSQDVEHKLIFTQTTKQETASITITYTEYEGEPSRTFTFYIKEGIHFEENTNLSESGLSSSRRMKTEMKDYSGLTGSTLNINQNQVGNECFVYNMGGLSIYTNNASSLSLTFDINDYVLNGNDVLETDENLSVDIANETQKVEFVHSAQEVYLNMSIKIKDSNSDDYEISKVFYLTVIQTYTKLQAAYLVEGADHENVPGFVLNDDGSKTAYSILGLHNEMLNPDETLNRYRFNLLGTNIDPRTNNFEVIKDADLFEMGFATYKNPNYIEFSVAGNASIKGNNTENTTIVFNTVTKNTLCDVYLNNKAGMETNSVWYTYQIMASDKEDGLNFEKTNGYYSLQNSNTEVVSFLMDDTDDTSNFYTSNRFVIGSMLDERNNSIFNLTIDEITSELSISKTTIVDGESNGFIVDKKGQQQSGDVIEENDYVNAIQYCFTQGNYKYYITYDCDENSIDLIVNRKNGSAEEQIILTINIGGVNGNNTIVKELKIVLSNCPISSQFEDSSDVTVYAGDLIYLSDKINKDNANITYSLKEGDYTVNGKAITLSSDDVDNALFTFNDNKTIQTKAVGANTRARIVLIAYLNGYAIKEVIYNFVVKLNLQFIVNDGELVQGADTETNFVLTTTSSHNTLTSGGFPITVDFIANTKVVKTGQYANVEGEYYNVLACDLYNLVIQGNENASKNELLIQGKGFNIELYSNISNKILEVSNSGIVFQQDYCGDVELKLSVPTANGTYSVIWTIHVSGIKNQSYASKDANYARLQINSMPFNSGDIVNIFNTQTGSGVGVIMNNPLYFAINDTNIKMTFTYEYVINALNQETSLKTNEALFTNSDSNKKGSGDGYKDLDITKNVLSITLPSVPTTSIDAQQSYFVTYKIYATYLGLNAETAQVFYVTYRVINYQQLETLSADINVDNLTKLGLFYFDENYKTTSGIDYKFTYEKPNIMLNGTICSIEDVNGNIKIKFSSGYYDVNDNIIYDNSNVEIKGGTWSSTSEKEGETVFRSKFANIYEYKKFIDAVSVQIGESNKYVFDNLSNFGNGIYGIDLSSKFTGNNKFENELCADFKLMENRVATYTVPAYSIENKNGFRLTTSNKITANTKDGDQEGIKLSAMFLPSYFEPNAAIANNPVTLNTPIIGVGDPSASWVNKGSANTDDSTEYATITIPGGVEYTVKKVVYSDGSGTLYKLEREYYYIKESTVVVPDYRAVGIETTFFNVVYQYGNTNQTLDLDKGFKVWTMKDMGEGKKRLTSNEVEKIISSDDLNCDISEPSLKRDGDMIKINSSALMNYKKQYPNKSQYPTVKAEIKLTANASVFTFECDIKFALPQYVTVGATFNDATTDGLTVEDLTVSLIDQIYIPVKVGTAVEYNLLDSLNVSKITSIYESEYLKSYKDGELIFDSQKIKLYFDETAKEELRILCELSTQDGVLEFEVVVEDTRST